MLRPLSAGQQKLGPLRIGEMQQRRRRFVGLAAACDEASLLV